MAEVFKAKSYGVEGFEKIIAIKRILPTMGEDRDFIKMFIDEAKIAGQLAHANICQIFELGRIDGSHFIAMEYIWGKDLLQIQNRLRKTKQQMPVAMACFALAKVLEGLDYAHRKRDPLGRPLEIVHRDCSPQNVLVSYEGEVKVIDFGIAKATSRNSRTMAGVLKGKFGYMSPEQVRGLPLDRRSDLFALGTMLYECLTGDRLFQGETDFSTLEKVRNVDIRRPRELNPDIPEAVETIILKALAKDVDNRYQWCSEMLADLQQFLMSQEVVFTAKTLSSWIKDAFSPEIDKERQLLEQYKRVGRDGLIAGLPSAAAKLDVVEHLGEAPLAEGDATQLGGPSFEDLDQDVAVGAAPEVGPAPGSPAARGEPGRQTSQEDGDFGEEAPTEIFGEIEHALKPDQPTAPSLPISPGGRSTPPRPPTQPQSQYPAPQAGMNGFVAPAATPQTGFTAQSYAQNYGSQAPPYAHPGGLPVSSTHGGSVGQPLNALPPSGSQLGKTLLGAALPPGLEPYGSHQPSNPPGQPYPGYPEQPQHSQHPSQPQLHGMYPSQPQPHAMHPSQPQLQAMHPSQAQMQPYPSAQGYLQQPQNGQASPYGAQGNPYQPGPAGAVPAVGRKKSSIVRDVVIGVAIAAVVLGGFLAVKFLILDSDDAVPTSATPSGGSIATLKVQLPANVAAELFLDDSKEKVATVKNLSEIPVTAGQRKVRIVSPDGQQCEQEVQLLAGKTTAVPCNLHLVEHRDPTAGSGSAKIAEPPPPGGSDKDPKAIVKPADPKTTTKAPDPRTVPKLPDPKDPKSAKDLRDPPKDPKLPKLPVKTPDPKNQNPIADDDNPADKAATIGSKGFVAVSSNPSAKVAVDSIETGQSTPVKLPLSPGKHKVTFSLGASKSTFTVVVKPGETTTLHKDLQ